MRRLVIALAALIGVMGGSAAAVAEWQPSGPIKLAIAFAAGGGADTISRQIADELQKRKGWEIIPQQITGGGGAKLAAALKDEPNDGTTIGMVVTETYGYNMVANPKAGFSQADMTPITTVAAFQMGVVAKSDKGWKTFADVVAAGKSGEKLRFGTMSPKLADLAFLVGEANGIDFNIIEVKGGKAVMNGVNAGDMDLGFMAGIQRKGVASGDLVNLASAMSMPLKQTPDAPLMADIGVKFNADGYFLFVGPAGMDSDARKAISEAIAEIVKDESTKAGGIIKKAFGGHAVISGPDLDQLLVIEAASAESLMMAVQ